MKKLFSAIFLLIIISIVLFFTLGKSYKIELITQTEELLRKEYSTSRLVFKDSYYTNTGFKKGYGAVCGKVMKQDYSEDANKAFKDYYVQVIDDGEKILTITRVDFDVSLDYLKTVCDR